MVNNKVKIVNTSGHGSIVGKGVTSFGGFVILTQLY